MPGIVRTYTFLPGGFSLGKAAEATAAGRTFVTTGPLLLATVDAAPPSSVFPIRQQAHILAIEAWAAGNDAHGLERLEILRNGKPFKDFVFDSHPGSIRTNMVINETAPAWYCARVSGPDSTKQVAVSGAFYFEHKAAQPLAPVPAQVHAQLLDAESGTQLAGTVTEVTYYGMIEKKGKRHMLKSGEARLKVPGTVRLLAEANRLQSNPDDIVRAFL